MLTPDATPLLNVYLAYAVASLSLTIWLARTLFKNGEVFLEDVFADNPRMAAAVNRLLVVGFYLFNLGYAMTTLKTDQRNLTTIDAVETLAGKLGALLLSLGVMHFLNMFIFHKLRRRGQLRVAPPPIEPQHRHAFAGTGAGAGAPGVANTAVVNAG